MQTDHQGPTDDQLAVSLSWPMGPPAPRRKFGRRATDVIAARSADVPGVSPAGSAPAPAPAALGQILGELAPLRAELSELRGEMVSLRQEMTSLRRRMSLKA